MTADAILAATIPPLLPTLMVLVGIFLNKNDINQVRGEINGMRAEIHTDINGLRFNIRMLTAQTMSCTNELAALKTRVGLPARHARAKVHDVSEVELWMPAGDPR